LAVETTTQPRVRATRARANNPSAPKGLDHAQNCVDGKRHEPLAIRPVDRPVYATGAR
jgi:hypothetical protein